MQCQRSGRSCNWWTWRYYYDSSYRFATQGLSVSSLLSAEKLDEVAKATMVGGATLTGLLGTSAWMAPGAASSYLVESIIKDQRK